MRGFPSKDTATVSPSKEKGSDKPQIQDDIGNVMASKRFERREKLPKTRVLGSLHPIAFEQDLTLFVQTFKHIGGRRVLSRGEILEAAFYTFRQQVTGEAVPDWVARLKDTD